MRRLILFTAMLVLSCVFGHCVGAQQLSPDEFFLKTQSVADEYSVEYKSDIIFKIGEKTIKTDDGERELDSAPIIIGDRAYLPVRATAEGFGVDVDYDCGEITIRDGLATARFNINGDIVRMTFDGDFASVYTIELSAAPVIDENDRCYLPMRNIAEDILGCSVKWNEDQSIVVSRSYQSKRLMVRAGDDVSGFDELPLAECFSNKNNMYILQFPLTAPDAYVRRCCAELNERDDILGAMPDIILKMSF